MKNSLWLMRNNVVTISDLGVVAIPSAPIQMTIYEIAELFDVFVPTVKARINAILKSKTATYYNRERFAMSTYFDLEMVIGVAFTVDSYKAEIFRQHIIGRVAASNVQPIYIAVDMQRVNNVLS